VTGVAGVRGNQHPASLPVGQHGSRQMKMATPLFVVLGTQTDYHYQRPWLIVDVVWV
jgi:hypothetical protein